MICNSSAFNFIQTVLSWRGLRRQISQSVWVWHIKISPGNPTEKWSLKILQILQAETWKGLSRVLPNPQTGPALCMSLIQTTLTTMASRIRTLSSGWGLRHFRHSVSCTAKLSTREILKMVCRKENINLISATVSFENVKIWNIWNVFFSAAHKWTQLCGV